MKGWTMAPNVSRTCEDVTFPGKKDLAGVITSRALRWKMVLWAQEGSRGWNDGVGRREDLKTRLCAERGKRHEFVVKT